MEIVRVKSKLLPSNRGMGIIVRWRSFIQVVLSCVLILFCVPINAMADLGISGFSETPRASLLYKEDRQVLRILGDACGIDVSSIGIDGIASVEVSEIKICDGSEVLRRITAEDESSWLTKYVIKDFDTALNDTMVCDYISIFFDSGNGYSLRAHAVSEGITSQGYDLVFAIYCKDTSGNEYAFDIVIRKAKLKVDLSGEVIPYGVNIQGFVNSWDFIGRHVCVLEPSGKTAYELLSLSHADANLFVWDDTGYKSKYPEFNDTLSFTLSNAFLNNSNIEIEPYSSPFIANFYMDTSGISASDPIVWNTMENERKEIVITYQAPTIQGPASDGSTVVYVWVNSTWVVLKDIPGERYEFSYTIDNQARLVDPQTELIVHYDYKLCDFIRVYFINTIAAAGITYSMILRLDETKPRLDSISVVPALDATVKNGYWGFDPNAMSALPSPMLHLVMKEPDLAPEEQNSGIASYSMKYRDTLFSVGTVKNGEIVFEPETGNYIANIDLGKTGKFYELSDFELTIVDNAGNKTVYDGRTLTDPRFNTDEVKGVIVDPGDHSMGFHLDPGLVSYTKETQSMTLMLDSFTQRLLIFTDPFAPVASIQTDSGLILIYLDAFTYDIKTNLWVFYYEFTDEGRYLVSTEFSDFLGHGYYREFAEFTSDFTSPELTVTFDNNNVRSGNFFNAPRTATLRVLEKNFDPSMVYLTIEAKDDLGREGTAPSVSAWLKGQNNDYFATVFFENELHYSLFAWVEDKAGNISDYVMVPEFVIDITPPRIAIEGLQHTGVYPDAVSPIITFREAHFDNSNAQVSFSFASGASATVFVQNSTRHGDTLTISVSDIAHVQDNDNVYIMQASIVDFAGNSATVVMVFSVNRFGSTYFISDETGAFLGTYINEAKDIVVTEINPSGLKEGETTLRLSRNADQARTLEIGKDYRVQTSLTENLWSAYLYTIPASNFTSDGYYRLTIRSIDLADNLSENTMESSNLDRSSRAEIVFALDTTRPSGSILNIEEGETYRASEREVYLRVEDNLALDYAILYINEKEVERYSIKNDDLNILFTYVVKEQETHVNIKLVVFDRAGNSYTTEKRNITISSNLLTQITHDPVASHIALAALSFSLIVSVAVCLALFTMKKGRIRRRLVFNDV